MFRKLTFVLALAALVALPIKVTFGQTVDPGKVSMVFMGSAAVMQDGSNWQGGFSIGTQFPFPGLESKGVQTRLVYSQFNISPDAPMRSIEPCALIDFYVGKKWRVWWKAIGLEAYTDGANLGTALYTGAGIGRRMWTVGDDNKLGVDLFLEASFVDASGKSTGSYGDLNLILLLTKL